MESFAINKKVDIHTKVWIVSESQSDGMVGNNRLIFQELSTWHKQI